jgi:hypothetical protein
MAKRKSFKKEWALEKARHTRDWKREMYENVCKKDKAETVGDIVSIFFGLSAKSVRYAAEREIMRLASRGYSPVEIVKYMETRE